MTNVHGPAALLSPLSAETRRMVHRRYIAHLASELLHERVITPRIDGEQQGEWLNLHIDGDRPEVSWRCRARHLSLDHWSIDPHSIVREIDGVRSDEDACQFLVDVRKHVGMEPMTLSRFLEETLQTLYADAARCHGGRPSAETLAYGDHQSVEQAMEGHPWVVVNKGRLGFDAADQRRYAPESGAAQKLLWIAAHRSGGAFWSLPQIKHDEFLAEELGPACTEAFCARLRREVRDPAAYVWIPVHEWQWTHKIVPLFADDFACRRLVLLGTGPDDMRAQQSIRTFANIAEPRKCYVKTALSILNTFQMRGLSIPKIRNAPLVTQWLRNQLRGDPDIERCGTIILGEIASVAYAHRIYDQFHEGAYQYREMLGALWRESAVPYLRGGESLASMAALLYVDDRGHAYIAELARRAAVDLEAWLRSYLTAYLRPLLHCALRHEIFFVAHGENTILVLEDGRPTRVVFKDLVEEVQVSARVHEQLPPPLRELFYHLDDELLPLFILTDVFDGFFRYLSTVLARFCEFAEERFWSLVADEIAGYEREHPELRPRFARYDLWRDEFPRFCINKYRMIYHGYAEASENVHDLAPRFSGTLPNPLRAFR